MLGGYLAWGRCVYVCFVHKRMSYSMYLIGFLASVWILQLVLCRQCKLSSLKLSCKWVEIELVKMLVRLFVLALPKFDSFILNFEKKIDHCNQAKLKY